MARKRFTAERIIGHLRQAEIWTSEGKTIAEAVRELGISEQTYYRWRKQYGGMEVSQARRLKDLEQENGRLKRLVADQALDLSILKEMLLNLREARVVIADWRQHDNRERPHSRLGYLNPEGFLANQEVSP